MNMRVANRRWRKVPALPRPSAVVADDTLSFYQAVQAAFVPRIVQGLSFEQEMECTFVPRVVNPAAAPSIVYVTAQTAVVTTGTTRTKDLTAAGLAGDDVLIAHAATKITGTITVSPPAGEGWTQIATLNEANVTNTWWWKRWGSGDTDDTTPTFTSSTGGVWDVMVTVVGGCKTTGDPFSQASSVASLASSTTLTSPVVSSTVGSATLTLWFFYGFDDNTLNAHTRGTSGYSVNIGTTASQALVYEEGVDSSVETCSVTESTNGPDAGRAITIVMTAV